MSSFTEPLLYESTSTFRGGKLRPMLMDGARVWELFGSRRLVRLTRGFTYTCGRTKREYGVPVGFQTDLGSIPSIGRTFLSPDDPWAQAYVLHDYLYKTKLVDRATADLILWDALQLPFQVYLEGGQMVRATCPKLYRDIIYQSVRLGGNSAYKKAAP